MFASTLRASLFALAFTALSVSAAPGLSVKVATPASFAGVESLTVVTTVTNTGSETVKIVNDPNGPLSPFPADTFAITDASGTAPEFTGAKVKWSAKLAAAAGEVTTLAPGESVDVTHDLKNTYDFNSSGEGAYSFAVRERPFYIIASNNEVALIHAKAESSSAKLSGNLSLPRAVEPLEKRATYRSCSSTQQTQLVTAASNAQSYAASSLSYLNSHTSSTTRFATWFGTYTDAHHTLVQGHFSKISGGSFSGFTYDCTCTDAGTYAYVYPGTYGVIYLCGAFWSAPATGTDSKAGTLIHECSHFTANGGTQDYVYGQTGAKSLAISNSNNACMNADNHEYFAENTPAQS